jgi:hypothetical protein
LFLDHGGSTLYTADFACANYAYQFFGVDWSTGALNYLGVTSAQSTEFNTPLSFIGNATSARRAIAFCGVYWCKRPSTRWNGSPQFGAAPRGITARCGRQTRQETRGVAVARTLAVLLHHPWRTGQNYQPFPQAPRRRRESLVFSVGFFEVVRVPQ